MKTTTETTLTGIELRKYEYIGEGETKYFVNDIEVDYYKFIKTETEEYFEYKLKDKLNQEE